MELEISIGNAEKARQFLKNISKKDRIALISHIDLDGIAAAKIMSQIAKPKIIRFINYGHLNGALVKALKKGRINKIILTDYAITKEEVGLLEEFAESLIIDHHQFEEDYNSEKTIFLNAQGYCAAYICYSLFEDSEKVAKFDWVAALSSAVDWCYTKNRGFMEKTYKKYGDSFDIENPRKGKFWGMIENFSFACLYFRNNLTKAYESLTESIDSMKNFDKYTKKVKQEFTELLKEFDGKKQEIKEGYIYEINSRFGMASEIVTELSLKDSHKTFLVLRKEANEYKGSARRQDKKINLPKLLQYAIERFIKIEL